MSSNGVIHRTVGEGNTQALGQRAGNYPIKEESPPHPHTPTPPAKLMSSSCGWFCVPPFELAWPVLVLPPVLRECHFHKGILLSPILQTPHVVLCYQDSNLVEPSGQCSLLCNWESVHTNVTLSALFGMCVWSIAECLDVSACLCHCV